MNYANCTRSNGRFTGGSSHEEHPPELSLSASRRRAVYHARDTLSMKQQPLVRAELERLRSETRRLHAEALAIKETVLTGE